MDLRFIHDNIGFVGLVTKTEDPLLMVVNSARISYNKRSEEFSEKDKKLTKRLYNDEHTSPFRHTHYTFHIKAPLFVFRQWMKHQIGSAFTTVESDGQDFPLSLIAHYYDEDKGCSWNEISGRYVTLTEEFYYPPNFRANTSSNKQVSTDVDDEKKTNSMLAVMKSANQDSYRTYNNLLKIGTAREIARMILPQNIYSEAYWTVSLQSLIHFLNLRLDSTAQYEIREFAKCIYDLVKDDLDQLDVTI